MAMKEGMLDLGNIYLLEAQKQASYRQQAEQCFLQSMTVLNERFSVDPISEVQLQKGNDTLSLLLTVSQCEYQTAWHVATRFCNSTP